MTELILHPDLGKRPHRLRCRFAIEPYPLPHRLGKAKYQAAERFVEDMRKQGWEYVSSQGFQMAGPFPAVKTVNLPKRSLQSRWHTPAGEALQRIREGEIIRNNGGAYARAVPSLSMSEQWEYELAGVFIRDAILTETPDSAEEKEGLKKR